MPKECKKLGIRSITILDTDCDPSDLLIPAMMTQSIYSITSNRFCSSHSKGKQIL
jgi:ribosomal protein S2